MTYILGGISLIKIKTKQNESMILENIKIHKRKMNFQNLGEWGRQSWVRSILFPRKEVGHAENDRFLCLFSSFKVWFL